MTHPPISDPLQLAEWCRSEPVTGDASPRRYRRLHKPDGQTAILVEYPGSDSEPTRRRSRGPLVVSSPGTQGSRPPGGGRRRRPRPARGFRFELMPKPPSRQLLPSADRRCLNGCSDRSRSWRGADPMIFRPGTRLWIATRLRWELAGFELWYVRHYRSLPPSPELGRWLDELAVKVASHPLRVCHRDYHFNNLLIQDHDSVGIIDIQDILVGPDTYDIVSLVADRAAARLISAAERSTVLATWARRTGAEPGWRGAGRRGRDPTRPQGVGHVCPLHIGGSHRLSPMADRSGGHSHHGRRGGGRPP